MLKLISRIIKTRKFNPTNQRITLPWFHNWAWSSEVNLFLISSWIWKKVKYNFKNSSTRIMIVIHPLKNGDKPLFDEYYVDDCKSEEQSFSTLMSYAVHVIEESATIF